MRDDQTVTPLFCSASLYTIRHIRRYVKREMKKLIRLFYQTSYSADKKTLAIKTKMCYIIDIKGATVHKVVDLRSSYINLPRPPSTR